MPNLNQRGPMGEGPMTGRKMGRCTNFGAGLKGKKSDSSGNADDFAHDDVRGRGFGFGQGGRSRGLGRQNRFRGGGNW
ncbi:MAG: DUF5320 domain-containing protein [Bacteroidales bacterium]|nr:DUF5320 domain-containing protein [Bacteroidales bacterium]